jgi:protein SCO1
MMNTSPLGTPCAVTAAAPPRPWRRAALAAMVFSAMGLALWATVAAVAPQGTPAPEAEALASTPSPAFASPLEGLRLVRQDGAPLLPDSLRGKTVLLNFAFTACSATCPGTTQQLRQVQQAVAAHSAHIEFVTVSVDPLSDTPAVLQHYAQAQGVDFKHWQWLTGEPAQVQRLIQHFGAFPGDSRKPEDHLTSLFLIDGFGRVIGRLSGAPVNLERTQRELLDVDRGISARARLAQA